MRPPESCVLEFKYFATLLVSVLLTVSSGVFASSRDRVWAESTLKFSNFGGTLPASERANLNLFGAALSKGCSLGNIIVSAPKQEAPRKKRTIAFSDGTVTVYAVPPQFETSISSARIFQQRATYIAEHLVKVHGYERQFIHIEAIDRFNRYQDTNEISIEGTSFPECDEKLDRYGKLR
jgi:hypothetical protein